MAVCSLRGKVLALLFEYGEVDENIEAADEGESLLDEGGGGCILSMY